MCQLADEPNCEPKVQGSSLALGSGSLAVGQTLSPLSEEGHSLDEMQQEAPLGSRSYSALSEGGKSPGTKLGAAFTELRFGSPMKWNPV